MICGAVIYTLINEFVYYFCNVSLSNVHWWGQGQLSDWAQDIQEYWVSDWSAEQLRYEKTESILKNWVEGAVLS